MGQWFRAVIPAAQGDQQDLALVCRPISSQEHGSNAEYFTNRRFRRNPYDPIVARSPRYHFLLGRGGAEMRIMPFGKYKGQAVTELPDDYLAWLSQRDDIHQWLRTEVDQEIDRRQQTTGASNPRSSPDTWLHPLDPETQRLAFKIIKAGRLRLASIHHPDLGGDTATMQAINTATEWLNRCVSGGME
jgi:hypothetical protein